jgi:hypothetical protein
MAIRALFNGLVYDEYDNVVETAFIGTTAHYVVDDDGFRRHIDAEELDRQVLDFFLGQLEGNKDIAVEQMMNMMGQDDLFTKAAVSSSINDANADQILAQGIPSQARDMLGMMGFRIRINYRGELLGIDQPSAPDSDDDY